MKRDFDDEKLEEMEFVLDAKNGIQVQSEIFKVYSFVKNSKEYSFAIAKDYTTKDSRTSYMFSLYGVFEGRIMPFDVRMFNLPFLHSVRTKTWESAEVEIFDYLYEVVEAGQKVIALPTGQNNKVSINYLDSLLQKKKAQMGLAKTSSSWSFPLYWDKKDVRCKGHLKMSYEEVLKSAKATELELKAIHYPDIPDAPADELQEAKASLKVMAQRLRSGINKTIAIIEAELSKEEIASTKAKVATSSAGKSLVSAIDLIALTDSTFSLFGDMEKYEKPVEKVKRTYHRKNKADIEAISISLF